MTFEVRIDPTGDRAEAATLEGAVLAALTLTHDAYQANRVQGYDAKLRAVFTLDGEPLLTATRRQLREGRFA